MVFIVSKNYVINNFRHLGRGSGCCCGGRGGCGSRGGCSCGRCGGCGGCWCDVAGTVCPNFVDCHSFQGSFAV